MSLNVYFPVTPTSRQRVIWPQSRLLVGYIFPGSASDSQIGLEHLTLMNKTWKYWKCYIWLAYVHATISFGNGTRVSENDVRDLKSTRGTTCCRREMFSADWPNTRQTTPDTSLISETLVRQIWEPEKIYLRHAPRQHQAVVGLDSGTCVVVS
jgi:hypothetical protein